MKHTLNELKENVARLVILVLVIEFFGVALSLQYAQPLDLLYLAVCIILVSGGIFLTAPRSARETRASEDVGDERRNEP